MKESLNYDHSDPYLAYVGSWSFGINTYTLLFSYSCDDYDILCGGDEMKLFLLYLLVICTNILITVITISVDDEMYKVNQRIDKLEKPKLIDKPINTFGELADIKPEHRAMVMAIAMTESSCNYDVKHPDKDTKGIGGIKENMWALRSNINSLKAIEEVVEALEEKYDNKYTIIRKYKGGVTNLKSTQQCWDLYLRLEGIL